MKKIKSRGRPRLSDAGPGLSPSITLRAPEALLKRIDSYRSGQKPEIVLSEAVRRLTERGLKAEGY